VNSGNLLKTLTGHTGPVINLAFNAGGTMLLTASEGDVPGTARVWDVPSGQEVRTIPSDVFGIVGVFFGPDSRSVSIAYLEGDIELRGTIQKFDADTGKLLSASKGILKAVSRDGRRLAVQTNDEIQILDTNGTEVGTPLQGVIGTVAFSPQGDWLAYVDRTQSTFHVRTTPGDRILEAIPGYSWTMEEIAVSPRGSVLAASGRVPNIRLWDTTTGRLRHTLTAGGGGGLAFTPDGKRLMISGDGRFRIWDLVNRREGTGLLGPGGKPTLGLAFSPDGRYLATGGRVIRLLDFASELPARELKGHSDVVPSPVFSPDGSRLAANSRGVVSVWDVRTGIEVVRCGEYDLLDASQVAFSPDGSLLAASAGLGKLKVFAAASGEERLSLSIPGRPFSFAFSPDGRIVVAGSRRPLRVNRSSNVEGLPPGLERVPGQPASVAGWNVSTGQPLFTVGAGDWVSAMAFSPDGMFVLVVLGEFNKAGAVKLLDASSGQAVRTLVEKVDAEGSAAFSPELDWIASEGQHSPGTIKLWKLPREY
jgi:WD40 repeat protein